MLLLLLDLFLVVIYSLFLLFFSPVLVFVLTADAFEVSACLDFDLGVYTIVQEKQQVNSSIHISKVKFSPAEHAKCMEDKK